MQIHIPRFGLLRTRLTVLYAGLFAIAMLFVSAALYVVVERNAEAQVRNELTASGTIFDRLWLQRSTQLRDAAGLLARDYGFRAAVATNDKRTVESALDNLRARLGLRMAFIVGIDGGVTGIADPATAKEAAGLWSALDAGATTGVVSLGGEARQVIAAPVLSPVLNGWVVFTTDLGRHEMRSLERLSAIPLAAAVYQRQPDGRWIGADDGSGGSVTEVSRFIDTTIRNGQPSELDIDHGTSIALAKPLPAIPGAPQAVLLLRYPMALALAEYRPLQLAIALTGILGLLLVVVATWRMARSITRPVSLLDDAAGRLADGENVNVPVEGRDEIARLAASFNRMAAGIAERERRITHLAFNDTLTGLPNRALFHEHLDHLLRQAERRGSEVALFCLDLDDFKSINDTLGHVLGDELLRRVASRLTEQLGDAFIARLGGDEFVVVLPHGKSQGGLDMFARRTLEAIAIPMRIGDHDLVPSASIGIALSPSDGNDAETLLRNADLALHRAKAAGRHSFCFFEQSMNEQAQVRRAVESDLHHALSNGELEVHFQPLFDLVNNRIGAFEALLRWRHPSRGLMPPVEFVPIAEDTGLIVPIGAWVLQEACRQAAKWPGHIRVAVNVSSVQFRKPGLGTHIVQALQGSGLQPDRLEVEITESMFLNGTEETLKLLHSLRALGIRIALDDFGTGYSSLSYLQSFPFDKIKIDRSFIANLLTRPGASAIVKAITDLASALGMESTAEGVEEAGQLAELKAVGCTSIQGYLFGRPIAAKDIPDLLEREGTIKAIAA
jgi:diguanylate cyclase (GGDEF)-like protein